MENERLNSGSHFFTYHFINDLDRCFVKLICFVKKILDSHCITRLSLCLPDGGRSNPLDKIIGGTFF